MAHHDEGDEDAERQRDDGDEGRAQVKEEDEADHGDDEKLLEQLVAEVLDRALDEARAVVHRSDLDAPGQARLQRRELGLHRGDGLECVLARAHDDHAADRLAFAVELADAAPHVGAELDSRDVAEATRLINEQKATVIIEHLAYDPVEDKFDLDIFTAGQTKQDFSKAGDKLQRHIYDYVLTDSKVEREFVKDLDTASEVVVYAKLPRGFLIPTPVGDYNPDWAITFKEGVVKHIYFVAETKGSMSSMELREIEKTKIQCARKFFDELNRRYAPENVKYDVVDSFGKLMEVVK